MQSGYTSYSCAWKLGFTKQKSIQLLKQINDKKYTLHWNAPAQNFRLPTKHGVVYFIACNLWTLTMLNHSQEKESVQIISLSILHKCELRMEGFKI